MNRIRQLREERQMPQKQLSVDLGVSQPTVSDWESGRKVPSAKSTVRLAEYFGVSVDYLLGLDTEKGPLTEPDEEALDKELISLLTSLTPSEQEKAAAFVQGLIANREP